jgi:type I restriction enzyme, S subunit
MARSFLPKGDDPADYSNIFCPGWGVQSNLRSENFWSFIRGVLGDKSAQPNASASTMTQAPFHCPQNKDEQRAIANILGTLDDKIELNRRMNETLEIMTRALFKSWFVDFNPVRAKAEGRDPDLPKCLADLFPTRFIDSDLGKIPEDCTIGSILDHARLMSGGTPKTDRPEYWNGPISWASAKDVSQSTGSILVATERSITQRGVDESATQIVPAFCSVVVARGATTGRMVLFGRAMAMNQTCYALMTTTETPFALYCRLREEIDALVHAAHGSVFDTITTSTFVSSRIVLPLPSVLKAFEERIAPLFQRMLINITESRTLTALRDTLLPKLISGELQVKDAEKFIERLI